MTETINYHNDIVYEHRERMLNLKKYYPFFQVISSDFSQFRNGEYNYLDMGFLVMATLRYFIEENNFHETEVTYPKYVAFMTNCLKRDFGVEGDEAVYKDIADYVFDKLKNEGRPFDFTYYDPVEKKKRTARLKIIESKIRDYTVWYTISAEAVEFYLDTKEIRSESRISVAQMLLEKMIKAQDFKGGIQVIDRINAEVNRLLAQKNNILSMLSADVKGGIEAYEDFVKNGMRWFEDEQKLFNKNRELIDKALARTENSDKEQASKGYYNTIREIFELETQLKVAMNKHSQLLTACTDMSRQVDDIIRKSKLSRLRSHFDFKGALKNVIEKDDATILEAMLFPLFKPSVNKTFSLYTLDEAITIKPERYEEKEIVKEEEVKAIKFVDELEDERIGNNYSFLMKDFILRLSKNKVMTLREWTSWLEESYGGEVLLNGDFYSFMVHMCQKKEYILGENNGEKESFFDDIMENYLDLPKSFSFTIEPAYNSETIKIDEFATMADMIFTVRDNTQGGAADGDEESR